jgi:hypothetical protein
VTVTGKLSYAGNEKGLGGRIITFNGTGADNLRDDGVITYTNGTFIAKGASPNTVASGWKVQAHFAGDSTFPASDSAIKEYTALSSTL